MVTPLNCKVTKILGHLDSQPHLTLYKINAQLFQARLQDVFLSDIRCARSDKNTLAWGNPSTRYDLGSKANDGITAFFMTP